VTHRAFQATVARGHALRVRSSSAAERSQHLRKIFNPLYLNHLPYVNTPRRAPVLEPARQDEDGRITTLNGLFGSAVLEVAIGLALVYLLLAAFCTTANEWMAALLHTRAKMLRGGIARLLRNELRNQPHSDSFVDKFYDHPLIHAFMQDGAHPSYLPSRTFARTVMDLVTPLHAGSITFDQLEDGIKSLPDSRVRTSLLAVIQSAGQRIECAQSAIEGWYNDGMERVSNCYLRRIRVWTVILAAVITLAVDADSIRIAHDLWLQPAWRGAAAVAAASGHNAPAVDPILGWRTAIDWRHPAVWMSRLAGWLITVAAVSMGAPFWFDVLNKFVNLRWGGKPPEASAARH
jgi:hypothetical protein